MDHNVFNTGIVPRSGLVTRSGAITTGAVAQQLMPANDGRIGFIVQNTSAGDLWIRWDGVAAVGTGYKIAAGATFQLPTSFAPIGIVSIIGATTAQAFTAHEW